MPLTLFHREINFLSPSECLRSLFSSPLMLLVRAISVSGVSASRANLTSQGERTDMRKGHWVKQIMCLLSSLLSAPVCFYFYSFVCYFCGLKISKRFLFPFRSNFLSRVCRGCRSPLGVRLGSPRPRARPIARDSTVSTNAFRAE